MATVSSRRPTTADSALASLRDARNVVRRAMGVGPALESTNELLNAIMESMADRPEYFELEQSCVRVREVLGRGTNRKQDDHLSLSALDAIDELTATANEVKKNIVKQGKRRAISRAFRPKKEKGEIAGWRLSLNRILCVLEIEFGSGESVTVPATHHDGADPHTAVVNAQSGTPGAETIVLTAPHNVSGSRTPVSKVPADVAGTQTLSHEMDCNASKSGNGEGNPGCSTRVSGPDESPTNARGTISDVCSHIEETHTTVDAPEIFNRMPQGTIKGVYDNYQVAKESAPGESPPPLPKIFGRDELVKGIVNLVDVDDPTPIALTGTGGIGKTSVALAVLHDDRIKQRFGHHRRFLRCDQFLPSLPNFLRRLSEVIGAGIENPMDLASLRPFLHRRKMLLVIDNGESLSGGPNTEDILAVVEELGRLRNIYLCITSRISIVPARCKHIDVPTLSMEAACETFYNIYRRGEKSDKVNDILKQLDFHPLSVTLLATAAKSNKWGIDQLEKEWEDQRTRVLRTRYHGSLSATIEFTLRSPMFRDLGPHARDLLGVVAFFPQGVDEKNLDWLFPTVPGRRNIFVHFCVLSLTHRNEGFITMLAPLRDHFRPEDPTSASLLCLAKESYFSRLSFVYEATYSGDNGRTRWIKSEDVNVEHLLDIFTSANANSKAVWDACGHFMDHLRHDKPRTPVFGPKILGLPDDYPSKPQCLLELSNLCLFVGNITEAHRLKCHALKLYRGRGDDVDIAFALAQLSPVSFLLGLYDEGIRQAREGIEIHQRLGDIEGVVACHAWLSSSLRRANKHDDADECDTRVIGLIDSVMPTAGPGLRRLLHSCLAVIYSKKGDTENGIFHVEATLGSDATRNLRYGIYNTLARNHMDEGRLDDAAAHLEHARSLAANGSSEMGGVMLLWAHILQRQGKWAEARSEALRALDLLEKFGARNRLEEAKKLLQTIDIEVDVWASMDQFQASLARRIESRMILAALGGDISQDEKALKAAAEFTALLEKDGKRAGGPNFFEIRKAYNELAPLMDHPYDRDVNEAIAKRLAIPTAVDESDEVPPSEPLMRQENGPVVIWTKDPKLAHVGQLWQALYHVPQVRHRISQHHSPHPPEGNTNVDPLSSGTGGYALSAHEVFRNMELSDLSVVTVELSMERFPHRPWEDIFPCEDVEGAYKEISEQVETSLNDGLAKRHPAWPRLFHSRINDATSQGRSAFDARKDFSLISLGYNDGDESSDLVGCLANQVFPELPEQGSLGTEHTTTGGCTTMEPADVIAFALARDEIPPSPAAERSQQRRKFSFPESFHLDQFIMTSRPHVQNANVAEGEILRKTGSNLVRVGNKDFMKSILSSLHYYENVARSESEAPTDVERHAAIESSAAKLKNVIAHIDAEWNAIGTTAEQLEKESQNSSSSEQVRGNKYDLRAVLMHDGQKGREHVYSYINHEGAWWKVVDCTVTKVAFETVLNDENGIDVGAGAFFLIYSRSLSEPLKSEWPQGLEPTYTRDSVPSGSRPRP